MLTFRKKNKIIWYELDGIETRNILLVKKVVKNLLLKEKWKIKSLNEYYLNSVEIWMLNMKLRIMNVRSQIGIQKSQILKIVLF